MRSRAELALRVIGLAALAVALYQAVSDRGVRLATRSVTPAGLPGFLAGAEPALDSLVLLADSALDPLHRDWLAAEQASGRSVRWRADSIPALAMAVDPAEDPAGGTRVLVAAPDGSVLQLADSAGSLDSASARAGGASYQVPRLLGAARAGLSRHAASAPSLDSLLSRRIVVFGRPSWETKFVVAALEERGWPVDVRIPLTPDVAVVQGTPIRLDTALVAAVVVLDAAGAPEAARIERFVREGGGLVLGAPAAALPAFAPLRIGVPARLQLARVLELPAAEPRGGLPLAAIATLVRDAVPLEQRGRAVAVAGRRVGAGRVLQLGYEDTWRWRMTGPEGAVAAHRKWWSSLVGSVAYRATLGVARGVSLHDAPLARMVARLGPQDPALRAAPAPNAPVREGPAWWLCVVALGAFLTEWASRRLRGVA